MFFVEDMGFKTQTEYENALKDKAAIDDFKSRYDLNNPADIKRAYKDIKTVHFLSAFGDRFDDYLFELYESVNETSNTVLNKTSKPVIENSGKVKASQKPGKPIRSDDIRKPSAQQTADKERTVKISREVYREVIRQQRFHSAIVIVLLVFGLGCIAFFARYYFNARKVNNEARELSKLKTSEMAPIIKVEQVLKKEYGTETVIPEILDEYKILYNKNKSLIGWIKIDDTIIDYPVMQTYDNEYYLKHNFNQQKDSNGCIFLDCNCDVILGNTNFILYGHHMNSGTMFSSIVKYANENYYAKHKIIEFDTIYEKGKYEVMYAFRSHVYNTDEITFKYYQFIDANSSEEFDSYMEEMDKMSLIDTGVTASYGDRLLTLSTCDYQEANGRFVVVAKRIE